MSDKNKPDRVRKTQDQLLKEASEKVLGLTSNQPHVSKNRSGLIRKTYLSYHRPYKTIRTQSEPPKLTNKLSTSSISTINASSNINLNFKTSTNTLHTITSSRSLPSSPQRSQTNLTNTLQTTMNQGSNTSQSLGGATPAPPAWNWYNNNNIPKPILGLVKTFAGRIQDYLNEPRDFKFKTVTEWLDKIDKSCQGLSDDFILSVARATSADNVSDDILDLTSAANGDWSQFRKITTERYLHG